MGTLSSLEPCEMKRGGRATPLGKDDMPLGMLKALAEKPVLSRSMFSIQALDQRRKDQSRQDRRTAYRPTLESCNDTVDYALHKLWCTSPLVQTYRGMAQLRFPQ